MKIKKIGQCCLLIKLDNLTILTDPGSFTVEQNSIKDIDVVLITHEHGDHLHIGSLKEILINNKEAKVFTNSAVGKILDEENIGHEILEGIDTKEVKNVLFEAFDGKHEEIYNEIGQVQNTGYFIDNKLFYPGDSFKNPKKPVDVLALPVSGPWCRLPDAIRYALSVSPKKAFPVHDGMLKEDKIGLAHNIPNKILNENGIEFIAMKNGDEQEF